VFEPVDELRIDEQSRQRVLDAGLEAAQLPARLEELHEHRDRRVFSLTGLRSARVASLARMRRAQGSSLTPGQECR
jgi:hypothetical protein